MHIIGFDAITLGIHKEGFLPTKICQECKGRCCKQMGCAFSPDDFEKIEYNYLKTRIEEGTISIDWWDGDIKEDCEYGRIPYLRMRNKKEPIVYASWGGTCCILTEDGCPLSFEDRPKEARMLKVGKDKDSCESNYGKKQYASDWRPYVNILENLISYFK